MARHPAGDTALRAVAEDDEPGHVEDEHYVEVWVLDDTGAPCTGIVCNITLPDGFLANKVPELAQQERLPAGDAIPTFQTINSKLRAENV